jgi:hypothetical protein
VATHPVPVPTEGWDAISPLAAMDPKRAPILNNWVPRTGWVELRQGYALNTICGTPGSGVPVETLMVRRPGNGAEQLFAASGPAIYSIVNGVATAVQTGLTSARWQYLNYTPAAGTSVIQLCNGADNLRQYDGTSWTQPSITGLPGGATTANIINIAAYGRRIWYVLNNTTVVAYMPTDALTGAITGTLDFGALWSKGGNLVAMADWTVDGGNGPQDYAVFISSRGQISVFAGIDPTNASVWTNIGTFNVAPPIGRRCLHPLGSDVALITQQGVLPLSQVLPFDPSADRSVALTSRIQNAMANAASVALGNFGWQLITYPAQALIFLNVPLATNSEQVQFVMNALTGAWCQFLGWNANCFEVFDDQLYFGDNVGNVNLAYSGGLDLNLPINSDMQCAFNYFDDPGRVKRMTMVQPLLTASGIVTPTLSVDEDFSDNAPAAPVIVIGGSGALWDSAVWDQSTWPQPSQPVTQWLSVQAIGHALAVRMQVNSAPVAVAGLGVFDVGLFDSAEFDEGVPGAPVLQVNSFNSVLEYGGFV